MAPRRKIVDASATYMQDKASAKAYYDVIVKKKERATAAAFLAMQQQQQQRPPQPQQNRTPSSTDMAPMYTRREMYTRRDNDKVLKQSSAQLQQSSRSLKFSSFRSTLGFASLQLPATLISLALVTAVGMTWDPLTAAIWAWCDAARAYQHVLSNILGDGFVSFTAKTNHDKPTPCFLDFPMDPVEDHDSTLFDSAMARHGHCLPCPTFGICNHGRLIGCRFDYLQVDARSTSCLWNSNMPGTGNDAHIESLRQTLADFTVHRVCTAAAVSWSPLLPSSTFEGRFFDRLDEIGGSPLYNYLELAETLSVKYDPVMLQTYNSVHDNDVFLVITPPEHGSSLVGLHSWHDLDLNLSCRASRRFVRHWRALLRWWASLAGTVWSTLCFGCKEYTLLTIAVGAMACFATSFVRAYVDKKRKLHEQQLVEDDFLELRDRVLEELSRTPGAVPVPPFVIRDRIIQQHDCYTASQKRRAELVIFPLVYRHVQADARVQTIVETKHGVSVTYWPSSTAVCVQSRRHDKSPALGRQWCSRSCLLIPSYKLASTTSAVSSGKKEMFAPVRRS